MRLRVEDRVGELSAAAAVSAANRIEWGDRSLGIIAEGIAYQYVRELSSRCVGAEDRMGLALPRRADPSNSPREWSVCSSSKNLTRSWKSM